MSLGHEFLSVGERAEFGIDLEIIAGVIAGRIQLEIEAAALLRFAGVGIENGRHPNRVHPETFDVVERIDDAAEIALMMAGAVAGIVIARWISIDERFDHDLVRSQVAEIARSACATGVRLNRTGGDIYLNSQDRAVEPQQTRQQDGGREHSTTINVTH